jgi:RimJ/RimL family protein N-acetyltransferase
MMFDSLGTLFTGELIRLAALSKADRPTIARWDDDAEFDRLMRAEPAMPTSVEALEREAERNKHHDDSYGFAIRTLAEDKLIGYCRLTWVQLNHRHAWLAIGIGEADNRGKGYGTDAMRVLSGYAFRELDLHRLSLSVFSYNLPAIRCYEKVGFVREVVQRAALYRDGQRHDAIIMGLVRSDWEARFASERQKERIPG